MARKDRAERMVDFGLDEAKITFDLGAEPTEEEINRALMEIASLPEEQESPTVSQMTEVLENNQTLDEELIAIADGREYNGTEV